ncbi:MAG: chemotaxis protein CheW [Planctomycetes bacterium]|nr:chemotaxis protein CheW [Planctomycetota bacterium]
MAITERTVPSHTGVASHTVASHTVASHTGRATLADAQRMAAEGEGLIPGGDGRPSRKFLRVRIGKTPLALPLEGVREVLPCPPRTRLYRLDAIVVGLCAVRGDIVAILDLDPVAPLETTDRANAPWLAVLHEGERTCGILAHEMMGIATVEAGAIAPLVSAGGEAEAYLEGALPADGPLPPMGILRVGAWMGQARVRRLAGEEVSG